MLQLVILTPYIVSLIWAIDIMKNVHVQVGLSILFILPGLLICPHAFFLWKGKNWRLLNLRSFFPAVNITDHIPSGVTILLVAVMICVFAFELGIVLAENSFVGLSYVMLGLNVSVMIVVVRWILENLYHSSLAKYLNFFDLSKSQEDVDEMIEESEDQRKNKIIGVKYSRYLSCTYVYVYIY